MKVKKFDLIKKYKDCVILRKEQQRIIKWELRDNEGDILKMIVTESDEIPEGWNEFASDYSLEKIHNEKKTIENEWRREFVKA